MEADFEQVKANLAKRDHIDSNRNDSPLKQADDALLLDNSHMTLEEQMLWFREEYEKITSGTDGSD